MLIWCRVLGPGVSNLKVRSHLIKCSNSTSEFRHQKEIHLSQIRPVQAAHRFGQTCDTIPTRRTRVGEEFLTLHHRFTKFNYGTGCSSFRENWHSWYVLTACESGRWETVNGWVKHPSVMCLLCLFLFLSWWHKWIFPWTPCFHLTWILLWDLSISACLPRSGIICSGD